MNAIERNAHIWERGEHDWYVEPERVTTQLLEVESFHGYIWDPCCGGGNILKAAYSKGYSIVGTDVVDRGALGFCGISDFLSGELPKRFWKADSIISNPPYFGGKGTEAFIRKALSLANEKVAVFVDRRFLTGKKRAAGLYTEHPPTRVWEITPRPSCPTGEYLKAGNKAGGGTADFCWMVWDIKQPSPHTTLGWLKQ